MVAELQFPDIIGKFLQGEEYGREQRKRRTIADYAQRAISGDTDALGQIYRADPGAGLQFQRVSQQQSEWSQGQADESRRRIGQLSRQLMVLPRELRPAMYKQLLPELSKVFGDSVPLPPEYDDEVDHYATAFADALDPQKAQEGYTLSPGSARFGPDNKLVAQQPFAPQRPDYVLSPDGTQWLRKPMEAGGSSMQAPSPTGSLGPGLAPPISSPRGDYQDVFASIAAKNGSVVTSGVRPVIPGVGAGASSQHPQGTAADFRTNGLSDAQIQGLMNDLREQGFEVIDERDNRNGLGPHIHAELPPGGRRQGGASSFGAAAIPIPGATPRQTGEETFSQPQVVTNPITSQQELVQFGNRGGRKVVTDYAPGPTTRDAKPPTEGERNAAGYYDRMSSAERELEAVVKSGYSPGGARDFYTAGQGPFLNWMASTRGQMYRQQQEDWVRAKLRKESGAVIGDEEMSREIKVYFPQPGDSPEVVAQKKKSREIAISAMRKAGGRAIEDGSSQQQPTKRQNIARPQTQADFAALPSNSLYIDPDDGKTYRKP